MNRRDFLQASGGLTLSSIADFSFATGGAFSEASVVIHPGRETGRIDKMIYGHFLEHVENVVYKGIYDPGSLFSDETGLRQDVIEAIKEMGGAHVLRWPGGNFVSYYHWKDGIGPKEKRPERYDVVWQQTESNHFGTDEYLALCQQLECEPFITANMGNGTIEEACQWVAYCRHAKRRPPVKIWGLGNEHFGPWQVGHYTAEEYGREARQFGQFMRAVQKDLKFVGVGFTDPAWNETVLKHCGHLLDWLTVHIYGHRTFLDGEDDFDPVMATPYYFEQEIKKMADVLEAYEKHAPRDEPVKISLEEWNLRHRKNGELLRQSPRNIVDALFVARVFNLCQRLSSRVTMSNYVFLLNAHAPIEVLEDGIVRSATFDVYRLYATLMQSVAVQADVNCDIFSTKVSIPPAHKVKPGEVTAGRLDVSATRSPDGRKLALSLLNLDKTNSTRVRLKINGQQLLPGGTWHTLYTPDLTANNTLREPDKVRSTAEPIQGNIETITLQPHSLNILELSLEA